MGTPETNICNYQHSNCNTFSKVDRQIIQLVNRHYYDLQMYANYIFDIDSDRADLSDGNNFYVRILEVQSEFDQPTMPLLFSEKAMKNIRKLVEQMQTKLQPNWLSVQQYSQDLINPTFFATGAASASILIKADRMTEGSPMPVIIKIVPLEFPHHYPHLNLTLAITKISPNKYDDFIQTYIHAPSYALFLKEAWMYCFSSTHLAPFTPTFTCIANCSMVTGFPFQNRNQMRQTFLNYDYNRLPPYKKWFNILINPNAPHELTQRIMDANYGCFEMGEIEGTWATIQNQDQAFDLGMIFEYLYSKLVSAFIGRIIFTDDHFDNVGYVTVDHARAYHIKCNGCTYHFYIRSPKMVQFIDLERYVFNFSPYDIYTNRALLSVPDGDHGKRGRDFEIMRDTYRNNKYIADKSLSILQSYNLSQRSYVSVDEYKTAQELLKNPFVYDIRTFCQIMDVVLPSSYTTQPADIKCVDYYLDLDDDNLRIIDQKGVFRNI